MATIEQMVAANTLVRQAAALCERLRAAHLDSATGDNSARYNRLYAVRRKAIERCNRRAENYTAIVYGKVQP